MEHIVVVGASLAGLRACEMLRTEGFTGRITLVGAEDRMPYDRPPLSKKLLAGEWEPDRIALRKPDDFASLNLDLRLGVAATALDTAARTLALADGSTLAFDGLIIATGGAVRRLPGQPDLTGVHELRTLDDALALREALDATPRVVVIGAGFIGLEVAATARQRGCEVTVLEGASAPLMRGLGAEMGALVARVHERNGVAIHCGVQVAAIEGDAGAVTGVRLGDGTVVPADVVLVGIGVAPVTGWLADSGLELRDGIVCDATLCVGIPGIYAAGDCARWVNPLFGDTADAPGGTAGEEMRVEHWTNAAEQGAAAARNMLAVAAGNAPTPYEAVPFFWSDQFDSRIQFLGRPHGDDEVRIVHGLDAATGEVADKFVALYGQAGRFRGVLGVSMPKQVMPLRKLLLARATFDEAIAVATAPPGT
jgi:NADPH-dependent 2,4-dienoyl-CoA reductase/sulfur reductase-like enzyme